MVSTILSHSPGGASSKLCTHMAQIFRNGEHLSKYDYGPEINLKVKAHTMLDLEIVKLHILFSSERQCSRTDDLIFTGLRDVSSRALQHVECGCSNCAHRRRQRWICCQERHRHLSFTTSKRCHELPGILANQSILIRCVKRVELPWFNKVSTY